MSDTHKEGFFYFGVNSLKNAPCICPICKFIKREEEKAHTHTHTSETFNYKQGFRVVLE